MLEWAGSFIHLQNELNWSEQSQKETHAPKMSSVLTDGDTQQSYWHEPAWDLAAVCEAESLF